MSELEKINKEIYDIVVGKKPNKVTTLEVIFPQPTESDYQKGYITRYFARQANSPKSSIIEISQEQYGKIRGDNTYFYKTISVDWKITGELNSKLINGIKEIGVLEANQNSINEAKKTLPKIDLVLNNLVQFYIGSGKVTTTSEGGGNAMNGGTSSGGTSSGGITSGGITSGGGGSY